jgi:hypothetical protein
MARVGRDYATALLERYGDPKLAAIAYNMGPGATDKWLAAGADMSKLPRETQGYVKGFAGGGEVQHFAEGDLVAQRKRQAELDRASMMQPIAAAADLPAGFYNSAANLVEMGANAVGIPRLGRALGIYDPDVSSVELPKFGSGSATPYFDKYVTEVQAGTNKPAATKKETKSKPEEKKQAAPPKGPSATEMDQSLSGIDLGGPGSSPANMGAPVYLEPVAADAPAKTDPYAKFEELFAKREDNLAKQREQDKYMAMLQAGLGMMGGTSRYALANIGAGGQQGIQALAQSNAARTAEENALLSGRLGLAKIGATRDYQDAVMAYRKDLAGKEDERKRDLAGAAMDEKKENRGLREQEYGMKRLADINKNAEIQAEKAIAANPAVNFAADRESKKQAMIADILRRNSAYSKTYQSVFGKDANPFEGLGDGGKGSYDYSKADKILGGK